MAIDLPPPEPAAVATAETQLLLELINAERARAGVQPLVLDLRLGDAAAGHSRWMARTGSFTHGGAHGSKPRDRIIRAGFQASGSWVSGENIGWVGPYAWRQPADEVRTLHDSLMDSPGHRKNLLDPAFSRVGLGLLPGARTPQGSYLTQNFATAGQPMLTGVAFQDRNGDGRYGLGEGRGAVRVTVRGPTGQAWTTSTAPAGGYAITLPPGRYVVSFDGGRAQTVELSTRNRKLDAVLPGPASRVRSAALAGQGSF
jgi:uncharacterized protein YkwD